MFTPSLPWNMLYGAPCRKDENNLRFNAVAGTRLKRTSALFNDATALFAIRLAMVVTDAGCHEGNAFHS